MSRTSGVSMSSLAILGPDGLHAADEVLNELRSLQKEYLIDLRGRT
jgi:uncharacterized membrane protein